MRTHTYYLITLILLALFFSGCMVGPKYQKPVTNSPEAYRMGESNPDSAYNLRWWELFNDPVLNNLITSALDQNKDIRIAVSRIGQARATLGFTKADQYPKIGYEAGASHGNFAGGQKLNEVSSSFYGAANLQWEIDFWGKYRYASNAARADLLASEYAHRAVQVAIISEVANIYFQLLDYKQRLEISHNTLLTREESLDIMQQRYDKGIIAEIDLNQAQIQRAIAAGAVPQYERAVAQTENAMQYLLGKNPGTIETGANLTSQQTPPEIPAGIPSTLLQRRPDILQAEQNLIAQNAQIGIAQAMRFPSINITGLLGVASSDLSTLTSGGAAWSVAGSLLGPIFNFGKNTRRVEVQRQLTEEAVISYEATVIQAFREVEDALIEIDTYGRQLEIKQQEFTAAFNANTLSRDRYDGGVTSYLEVLESERTLFSVELELSQTRQQYLAAYIKLYNALGGGWISQQEEQQTGDN
ncbi:MAG: efflux transporter outer membrane subunit [Bacteroidales bacterium]|nr:efflux transporter outer membrane subunit [Bacteroidales bacterium]